MTKRFIILAVVMFPFVRPAWRFLVFSLRPVRQVHGEARQEQDKEQE